MENKNTNLTIIRHGETEWNKLGMQQGQLNSDLTNTGVEQAQRIANSISTVTYDLIYSSDLGRALQTANIIGEKLNLQLIKETRLRERNLGILQGLTLNEFKKKYPIDYDRYKGPDPDYVIPDGESKIQRHQRCIEAFNEIAWNNPGKNIFIVTHGGILDSLFRMVLSIPLSAGRNFSLVNGSINRFSFDNESWKLESWGEISHLKGLSALDDF